jgi:universal stress protein E
MVPINKLLTVTPVHLVKQPVITRAIQLAKDAQAQLTFFSVAEPLPTGPQEMTPSAQMVIAKSNKEQAILQSLAQQYSADYANIDTKNVTGLSFIEMIKTVKHDHYDFAVLASKETEHSSKSGFDSNTMHLMRKCPCPIWAVGEQEPQNIGHIVAPVDVYAPTKKGLALNETILHWAAMLAEKEAVELHVIHAWLPPDDDYLNGWGFTSQIDRYEMVMKEQHDRQNRLDELVKRSIPDSLNHKATLIEGKPQEAICEYLDNHNADLVVMGTVCHTGIPGFFIGNVAESILSEVSCSVLALKPEGFVSPVE